MTTVHRDGTVEFRMFRPGAAEVRLAGSFSQWQAEYALSPSPDGWWSLRLRLPPGEHRFRYEVDGRWFTDFAAHGVIPAVPGLDSVIVVPESALEEALP
ncbi:MAG: glycogen-binding domain-containing protein [Tepidisphaerales bacterium]